MAEIKIRFSVEKDESYLIDWLSEPGILKWFPMCDLREIKDAARIWISFAKEKAVLTATLDDIPVGIANLYLNPMKKLAHQSLFAIIVDPKHRNKKIGTRLLIELEKLAKERFKIEVMHLEVYEENPAISLYERFGYKHYGIQKRFIKEKDRYRGKIFMQKELL